MEASRKMLTDAGITDLSEENIFIAATCKEKGIQFLKGEAKISVPYKKKEEPKKS
jgi:pyruvate carboxylase subunit B